MRPITYNDSGNRRTIPQQQNRNQQIMTTEPTHNVSVFDCDHQPQGSQATLTTEELLKDIRATMNFFIPRETVGRSTGRIAGWYSTEQTYQW